MIDVERRTGFIHDRVERENKEDRERFSFNSEK